MLPCPPSTQQQPRLPCTRRSRDRSPTWGLEDLEPAPPPPDDVPPGRLHHVQRLADQCTLLLPLGSGFAAAPGGAGGPGVWTACEAERWALGGGISLPQHGQGAGAGAGRSVSPVRTRDSLTRQVYLRCSSVSGEEASQCVLGTGELICAAEEVKGHGGSQGHRAGGARPARRGSGA